MGDGTSSTFSCHDTPYFPADYSSGFGGKYGVQSDRVDKSAKGWGETQKTELHSSQTDSSKHKAMIIDENAFLLGVHVRRKGRAPRLRVAMFVRDGLLIQKYKGHRRCSPFLSYLQAKGLGANSAWRGIGWIPRRTPGSKAKETRRPTLNKMVATRPQVPIYVSIFLE